MGQLSYKYSKKEKSILKFFSKLKQRKSQKGFSLIELMIVVAIIGILSAMAIPNFLRFQLRAKQVEAKTQLGSFYAAQKAFFAEWTTHFGDFRDIGFAPEGSINYRITSAAGVTTLPPNYDYMGGAFTCTTAMGVVTCTIGTQLVNTTLYCANAAGMCTELTTAQAAMATAALTDSTFLAVASSNLDADATIDEWTINESKSLVNTISDL